MQYLTEELKTLIHHILFKHKFYRLEMKNYTHLLTLLQEDPTTQPNFIQQCIFRGILNHHRRYKDNIAASLSDPRFDQVPIQAKQLLHRILHEFHFLYSIKAYEMFEPQYVQPGFNSSAQADSHKFSLDDDLQRYKLHAMYYGPLSMYHLGMQSHIPFPNASMFNPPVANISQERSMFNESNYRSSIFTNPVIGSGMNLGRSMFDEPSRTAGDAGFKLPLKQSKTNLEKEISGQRSMEIQRQFGGLRGRPSKQKKKLIQQLTSRRITPQLTDLLTRHFDSSKLLQQRNEELQFCVCQGFIADNSQECTVCHNRFHSLCQGRHQHCLDCRMKGRDPFNKIVETLGNFCIYDLENNKFEEQMNMKAFENICKKLGRFEVMVSCIRAGDDDEICWPDDCIFRINGEDVFEIPALLVGHPIKRRKDTGYYITPYIFRDHSEEYIILQKIKFSLEWKSVDQYPPRRNNRTGIFRLGFYLIEKITPNDLFQHIVKLNKDVPLEKPFDKDEDQVEIDHLSVTYFDPYSLALIRTPARGHLCKHFQCFDLQTFLAFTSASPERLWKCPFCGLDARRLFIDKYQLRILEDIEGMQRPPLRVIYYRDDGIDFQNAGIEEESSRNTPDF